MLKKIAISAVIPLILLSACKPAPEAEDSSKASKTEISGESMPAEEFVEWKRLDSTPDGVILTFNPQTVDFCEEPLQQVEVQWNLESTSFKNIQIWVKNGQKAPKLMVSTKALSGSKKTGKWTQETTTFQIVDPSSKTLIIEGSPGKNNCE